MERPSFSVVIISRNEENTLPRMIESLNEFKKRDGEIIILDTGSTDNTAQVARNLNCTVKEVGDRFRRTIDKELADNINNTFLVDGEEPLVSEGDSLFDFSSSRNYAASLATNDMIAMPDSDEIYTSLNIDTINSLIIEGIEQFEYNFVFAHDEYGKPLVQFMHSKFYNRTKSKWVRIVHEVLQGDCTRKFVGEDIIKLEHWQNPNTNRTGYLRGLALDCYEDRESDRNSHYFARECMYTGRLRTAIKEFNRHIEMNKWVSEKAQSYIYMGNCYTFLGEYRQAEECYHKGMQTDPTRREAFFALGEMFQKLKMYQQSSIYLAGSLEIPYDGMFYGTRMDLYKERTLVLQSVNKYYLGQHEEARQLLYKAIQEKPEDELTLSNFKYVQSFPAITIIIPTYKGDITELKKSLEEDNYFGDKQLLTMEDVHGVGCPKMVNEMVKMAKHDYIVFLGQDTLTTKNWLNYAMIEYYDKFKDGIGLVALEDGMHFPDWKPKLACHFLTTKRILPLLEDQQLMWEGVKHFGCDDLLTLKCHILNKLAYSKHAVIKHKKENDESGNKASSTRENDTKIIKVKLEELRKRYNV